jgi:hypothetical protein
VQGAGFTAGLEYRVQGFVHVRGDLSDVESRSACAGGSLEARFDHVGRGGEEGCREGCSGSGHQGFEEVEPLASLCADALGGGDLYTGVGGEIDGSEGHVTKEGRRGAAVHVCQAQAAYVRDRIVG